ncbi:uracil-DNA glycosylase [Fonticella tunisiensis]|uniref:Type-4 uracil-DNA glycosylase n=1 Tax=Fonticella tunisiensis TaxID=1096341 RepID=A0A4R7K551_9CLOT|nr:uracil-DNA glycosylase [Fonticella tunisiensis]TDT45644.1 DNA polymerase [Fonticella tunisiensis]
MDTLEELYKIYEEIAKDVLKSDSKVVFGDGNEDAEIMLIGEAPGEKEEQMGKPFVGAAGKNLDEFLSILNIKREDIYITNVVKIRPYKINPATGKKSNRPPNKREIDASTNVLDKQINIIKPSVVVTLGNIPLRAILKDNNAKIGDYHGKTIELNGFVLFPLYHPASIIYNRSLYDTYIEDVYKLKEYINEHGIGGA